MPVNFGILQQTQAPQVAITQNQPQQGGGAIGSLGGLLSGIGDAYKSLKADFGPNPASTANAAVTQTMAAGSPQQLAGGILGNSYQNPAPGSNQPGQAPQGMEQQAAHAIQANPNASGATSQGTPNLAIPNVYKAATAAFPNNPTMAQLATAQATQESGLNGTPSGLAMKANNLFGMKGVGDAGSVSMPTTEYVNGKPVQTTAQFAKYSSPQASMQAYAKNMNSNPRYKDVINAPDFETAADNVQKAGYATDPNYAASLKKIGSNINTQTGQMAATHRAVNTSAQVDPTATSGESAMKVASSYLGTGAHDPAGKQTLSNFFEKSGQGKVDPSTTPWCAAFANSVLSTTGQGGTGSLAARSFLKYGTPTNSPQAGDVTVFSDLTGKNNPNAGHVGFYAGPGSQPGMIKVLGGNESGAVSIKEYPESKVLGYREPPSTNELQGIASSNQVAQAGQMGAPGQGMPNNAAPVPNAQGRDMPQSLAQNGGGVLQQGKKGGGANFKTGNQFNLLKAQLGGVNSKQV